jgi:hypothetical protein
MKMLLISTYIIVDFKSLFNTRVPSSLQTCQLRFQVWKLGANFAKSSQVHFNGWTSFVNKCSYSIIITNSMKY